MSLEETHGLDHEAIHLWFGLSYASYLAVPRSLLQSMPDEWQEKFVLLLEEMDEKVMEVGIKLPTYQVLVADDRGNFIPDRYRDYERGRRRLW